MTFKISSEKIEEFIERQHAIDGMVSIHDFELWLEEQPRVGEWIPCSERLPEDEAVNPITCDYYQYPVTVHILGKTDTRYFKYGDGHWWNGSPFPVDEYVIAWMPLPPAYKEGE